MYADTTGMNAVRMVINIAIVHLPFLIPGVRRWFFTNRDGRLWDIVVYILIWYHWILFPATHIDPRAFAFADYGSWMENFTAYYVRDWTIRMFMEVFSFWTIGDVLLIAFTGVWGGDFYRDIRRHLPSEGKSRHLFLVPVILGTIAGIYFQYLPLK